MMNFNLALEEEVKPSIDAEMQHALDEMAAVRHGDETIVAAEILPTVASTLSLAAVRPKFEDYARKAELMVLSASKMEVIDEETNRKAVSLGGEAKKIAKIIDAQCKDVTQEASDFVDSVKGLCKIITERLVANVKKSNTSSIEIVLKKKITDYQAKIELDRRKQEEAARKAAAEFQAKLDAEAAEVNRKAREEAIRKAEAEARAKKASDAEIAAAKKAAADEAATHEIVAPQVPDLIIPKQETVTRTESGTSSHQVKTWKCYVDTPPMVPREYCVPDGRLLNTAVKQGVREIPGCRIVEESDTRFRT